jgi:hypothetical protein
MNLGIRLFYSILFYSILFYSILFINRGWSFREMSESRVLSVKEKEEPKNMPRGSSHQERHNICYYLISHPGVQSEFSVLDPTVWVETI